jgi:ABC-type cobalamin/Fe3+-siderophores transport system ATPase subunit
MLQRLYAHNFRCLENFELSMKNMPSALLIGKNGSGKSTIASVLEILQCVARGTKRLAALVWSKDFTRGRYGVPIRFEIESLLDEKLFKYVLALEAPERPKGELRIAEEHLMVEGKSIYSREEAQVTLHSGRVKPQFSIDRRLVALPLIQDQPDNDPIHRFRTWLARIVILAPIPSLMTGDAGGETLEPERDCSNFSEWVSGLLSQYPAAYSHMEKYLRKVMPDMSYFLYEPGGKDFKSMIVRFEKDDKLDVYFKDLSDGEKFYFLCAAVLAANRFYGPLLCFWDEPDNYLALSEIGHFVLDLRRSFAKSGQILMTSHNSEAILKFSDENTWVLDRKSHLEPTLIRLLSDIPVTGNLVDSLISGDIEL